VRVVHGSSCELLWPPRAGLRMSMMTLGDLHARNDPTKGREALEARTPREWCRGGWHGLQCERLVGAGGRKRCVDFAFYFRDLRAHTIPARALHASRISQSSFFSHQKSWRRRPRYSHASEKGVTPACRRSSTPRRPIDGNIYVRAALNRRRRVRSPRRAMAQWKRRGGKRRLGRISGGI
jgi:hypothetical protein